MTSTPLRTLYDSLPSLSTERQLQLCKKLFDDMNEPGGKKTLVNLFDDSLSQSDVFSNINQPFLNPRSSARRKGTLPIKGQIEVIGGPIDYRFHMVDREFPPLRQEGVGNPASGRGGIDYIARNRTRPILGEIKRGSDQNPFYAFIQLLTYLSEMATENQVSRANRWDTFTLKPPYESSLVFPQAFDLHILLVGFNNRSAKTPLIELTRQLAGQFKQRLSASSNLVVLGNVLCLSTDSTDFSGNPAPTLKCEWWV